MPQLYLLVRSESEEKILPPHKVTDITITGLPASLEFDTEKIVDTYTVTDNDAADGPWAYRVAVHIDKEAFCEKGLHISYGTMSREDALERLKKIPKSVKEANKMREGDENAGVKWASTTCVRIRLRKERYMWYELITVDVEDRAKWVAKEKEEAEEGRARKKSKLEIQEAVGEDADIFDDEEVMEKS
ncbi:hypothetical protein BDU57DRAFT_162245 [Ampelomyces quisqualis]|uniref:Uncharacterized protein n=1 Tax=Ampelomyces quisqualis TaxID=50730 RepID=A0A6A5QNV6_AMPQU|nr:hypothetical protein BDU57DRAFT_162245 [Ampelomyces quisqualis]